MNHQWNISNAEAGSRLDVFLASQLPEMTRSAIAKRLKAGGGTVNGKPASVHRFLKAGDEVEFEPNISGRPTSAYVPSLELAKSRTSDVRLIAETPDWLVIDKPTGLLVHPNAVNKTGTLIDWLLEHDQKIAKIGEDPERPGIIHRLDKEVSGLMVIAKTQTAFDHLKHQFAEHTTEKRYLALVHGEVIKDEGDIKFRIARSKTKARMAARPEHEEEGRAAWTHYKVIKRFRGATLLELNIFSGRTHQIRAHLLALGHPVVGDPLYALRSPNRKLKSPRLLLQAIALSFTDPATSERKTFDLPTDPAFAEVEKEL
ncbi:RluA family pseudouridine synthase [Candidatus Uhrbacteria bacterium]|nr:RluA family pseudouridine synthase [Candidatus Uhrbacteria bacterium]